MSKIYTLGVNHHLTPLQIREKVFFDNDGLSNALKNLSQKKELDEVAIISTCNRTEIYCKTNEPDIASEWLSSYHNIESHILKPYLYCLKHESSVRHVFRVASGLDSMIVGEPQILGQIKNSFENAKQAGTVGYFLDKLFQKTFSVAKEVRSTTNISKGKISIPSTVFEIARKIYPSFSQQNVLFVGGGEMINLCANYFFSKKPNLIAFSMRSNETGKKIANNYEGKFIPLTDLSDHLQHFDILVTCTSSTMPIIGKGLVEKAIRERKHKPVLIVDLAVPRDVEVEVRKLDDIFLYSLDDLGEFIKDGFNKRNASIDEAETIIHNNVDDYLKWLDQSELVPIIKDLRNNAEEIRKKELSSAINFLKNGENPETVLRKLSYSLTNKFLHGPTVAIKSVNKNEKENLRTILKSFFQKNNNS